MEKQGRWITVKGRHVFLKDGEELKFNGSLQKTVKDENKMDEDYNRLESDVERLMQKDYDEGTFLSVRARIIEELQKSNDPSKYDVLLGKFERDAQKKFGYTEEDLERMGYEGKITTVRRRK